jgi:hypothetical protein
MEERPLSTRDLAGASEAADDQEDRPAVADATDETETAGEDRARPVGEPADAGDQPLARDDAGAGTSVADRGGDEPLLPQDQIGRFTARWQEIQAGFVDEPRRSVEQADALVADLMQRLAASFSNERERLEGQWDRGDDVSTEDLRVALTRYRSFFDRLLSA